MDFTDRQKQLIRDALAHEIRSIYRSQEKFFTNCSGLIEEIQEIIDIIDNK